MVKNVIKYICIFVFICIFLVNGFDLDEKEYNHNSNNNSEIKNVFKEIEDSNYNKVVSYKNTFKHDIYIRTNDISIKCFGSGEYKDEDEAIVKDGMKIIVSFGNNSDTLKLGKGEVGKIYINQEFNSNVYPHNNVDCSYDININAGGI